MNRANLQLRLGSREGLSLVFSVAIVVLIALSSFRAWTALARHAQQVDRTQKLVSACNVLLAAITDAETGQRGYLLTGDSRYLAPYRAAVQRVPQALSALRAAARGRPDQAQWVEELKPLVQRKLAELGKTISLRQNGATDDALSIVRSDLGESLMERIRGICTQVLSAGNQRLISLSAESRKSARLLGVVATLGSAVICVLLISAVAAIQQNLRRRQRLITDLERTAVERKHAELALKKTAEHVKALLDANPIGVFSREVGGGILYTNDAFLSIIGYTREDLNSGLVKWEVLTPPEWRLLVAEKLAEAREIGLCAPYEKEYIRKDGSRVPVYVGYALIGQHSDEIVAFVLDLTDRKRAEHALVLANEKLSRTNDELEKFSYVVAHDLQAPMRTVSAMAVLLSRRLAEHLDDDSKHLVEYIETSVKQMNDLIKGLLEYSKAASTGIRHTKPIDCAELITGTIANLDAQIAESGAKVSADHLPMVQADDQLARVFQNLVENAIKYRSNEPPEIHVSARLSENEWVFSVRDNGIGFDPKYSDKIFGAFQRLHSAGDYPGTGIGLAVCKRTVERYGGRIWAKSIPGCGSTFLFSIPAGVGSNGFVSDEASEVRSAGRQESVPVLISAIGA